MKRVLIAVVLAFLISSPAVRADGPDDDYVTIYSLIQQGDTLNEKGELAPAITKYAEAQTALRRFQNSYPNWNTKVVGFRLRYLADKITELSTRPPKASPATKTPALETAPPATVIPTNAPASVSAEAVPTGVPAAIPVEKNVPPPAITDAENQIKTLQEQIRHIEADNALLEAKLKEALAAQPASVDPQEFARAQAQIKELQKDNELLRTSLAQANTNVAPAIIHNSEKLQQEVAEANQKAAQLAEANTILASEKEVLQNKVKAYAANDAATSALHAENERLKAQVANLQARVDAAPQNDVLNQKLREAQAQVAALQADKDMLQSQKTALEQQAKQTNAPVPVATAPAARPPEALDSVTSSRIAQLEAQRDELKRSLDIAVKDAAGRRKGKLLAAHLDEMTRELAALRPRIDILEAKPVPYTAEELALLSQPANTLVAAAHAASRKQIKQLPSSALPLLSEASSYFLAHQYDKAEEKYLEVLKLDDKNITTLADLASIQLQDGHTAEAEKNINAALAIDPNDDYSLFILGQLKFEEKNYNEAFDALSRAAQLNPQNAKIQNVLGLTLSEKGLRGPAETAFRKAIQLDPGFAEAHMNLAVVYLTQQPPLNELAKWHYQKALATGHPPNPHIEEMLNPGKAPVAQ